MGAHHRIEKYSVRRRSRIPGMERPQLSQSRGRQLPRGLGGL